MKTLSLILVAVVLGVVGQIFLKQGVSTGPPITGLNKAILATVFRPLVLTGFACYGLSSVAWLFVLSRTELSFAYPMIALGYVLVFILSWIIFHDKVTWVRVAGMLLIVAGVVVVALSRPAGTT